MNNKIKFALLLPVAMAVILFSCNQPIKNDETILAADSAAAPVKVAPNKPADKSSLVGNWVRTDAEYQLKISAVQEDGNMKAGYFNPKPINVGKAMWENKDGILKMYVELRDENYPGSNYKLNYSAAQDALTGVYFQAVEGTTYNVAFTRVK
jgi:hypothetical protein